MAQEVALTRIKYGTKGELVGNVRHHSGTKYVEVGDALPKDFNGDVDALRRAGALGDPVLALTNPEAFTAMTQSVEYPEPVYTSPLSTQAVQGGDEALLAHRIRTDQVARAEGQDVSKLVDEEAKATAKADEAFDKDAQRASANAGEEPKPAGNQQTTAKAGDSK